MKVPLTLALAVIMVSKAQGQLCNVSQAACIARGGTGCYTGASNMLCLDDTQSAALCGSCLCCNPNGFNTTTPAPPNDNTTTTTPTPCPTVDACSAMRDGAFCHKGQPTDDQGLECNPNFGICGQNCLCCWKKGASYCQDLKCSAEHPGGRCYEYEQVPRNNSSYECVNPPGQESKRLCGNIDCGCCWEKPSCPEPSLCMQVTNNPLAQCYHQLPNDTSLEPCGPNCHCCWPKEKNHCKDVGCEQQHQGLGQCVNISAISTPDEWAQLQTQYDMRMQSPYLNKFCQPSDGNMAKDCCVCLKKQPCKDGGCYEAGGLCVDVQKVNLQWDQVMTKIEFPVKIPGDDLCTPQDVQTAAASRQGQQQQQQSSCCECYKRKVNTTSSESPTKCEDTGCGKLWDGHGQCVNMSSTSWSQIHSSYNLTSDTEEIKNDRSLCKSSSSSEEEKGGMECCRCFRKKPCGDNGCEQVGGRCVDILRANFTDENVFPLNTVDLDAKINNGTNLCVGSETEKCCECYRLKVGGPVARALP